MAKSAYQLWKEAKEKDEQRKAAGKIHFKEDSKKTRIQTTLPQYTGQSKEKSYKWETDLLKDLKIKGKRSYNDKFDSWANSQGMTPGQAAEYRRQQDFEEDRKKEGHYAYGSMYESEVIDGIFKNMNERIKQSQQVAKATRKEEKPKETKSELTFLDGFLDNFNKKADEKTQQDVIKRQNQSKAEKQEKEALKKANAALTKKTMIPGIKKDEPFLTDVKNFFTGKDIDNDGQRDGLLGALDRYVLPISKGATEFIAPGNNERMIQNDLSKDGKLNNPVNKASLVDRGTETKVLNAAGTMMAALAPYGQAYKAADFGFNKLPKLANAVTNPYAQKAIKGAVAGGMAEAGLSATNELFNSEANDIKDYAVRTGLGIAGGAILDPALYGAGQAITKGSEKYAANVMKGLLPKNEQVSRWIADNLKADTALPVQSNKANPLVMNDLIPRGTDIANPNYLPDLIPQVKRPEVTVPKIGPTIEEALNNPRVEAPTPQTAQALTQINNEIEQVTRQLEQIENQQKPITKADIEEQLHSLDVDDTSLQTAKKKGRISNEEYYQKLQENELKREELVKEQKALEQKGSNVQQSTQTAPLEQRLKELSEQREALVNPPTQVQNLVPELNVNRTTQEPSQPLIPNVNRNTPEPPITALEQPVRTSEPPSSNLRERGHIETLRESENAEQSLKERIKGLYEPTTNEQAVNRANQEIAKGLESAESFVKSTKKLSPEHVATAHRLIQEHQKAGNIGKAVDIAEYIAEKGTEAGQTVQAFSIFNRLSPEGILVHANRVVDKANAKLNVLQEKVVLTNETAAQLTDLASTVQQMTKQKTIANDVITLMEKAKKGDKLSADETKLIRQFVDDAKQWIGDITPKKTKPKAPKKINSTAVKEQVVSFLDQQEEAARRRLEARRNRANSLPAEDFYDYAVIGASKLAKGTIKFADFTEQMVKEFGEEIRPYAQQIYDKASEMVNNEVQRTVNRLSEVQKITNKALKNGKLEEAEAENLRKFALSINNMSGDTKIQASQELQALLQGLERPSFLQQVSSAQTIAQLLNPKTLGRNAIGNEMFYRLERLNKLVATPIDWTRVAIFGGKRSVTFRTNNQAEYWKNWLRGWEAGWKGVNPEGLSTQYDLYPNSFNSKLNPMKYLEKTLGAALKSFDYAGYKRGVNNTIGELATLRATNEGLTGQAKKEAIARYIREVDENVLLIADQYGKYVTFQDNNILAVGLQKFKRGLNFGKDFGIGDLIIKYPKTPGALLARALEYSPAGFLKSLYAISKPFAKKGFSTSEVIESFTRALIGSAGTMGIAWFLADKGIITGSGSKDFDVKELEKSAGKTEYSLNIDALKRFVFSGFDGEAAETQEGDSFISYNWAQPIAMSVAIGANASYNAKNSGTPSLAGSAWEATNGALDSLVGMSVLQGVQKAFTSYPGQSAGDKLMDIAGQLPASFVPTLSNQIRQKADNTGRNVYDPLKLNQFKNQAINKVPVLESLLPAGYDTLGNQKEVYKDKSNSFFNVFLNPAFVNRYNPSPEAEMVLKVINDTGDESLAPRRAQKYLMIGGKRYDLTPQQYSDYQRRLGEEVRAGLQGLDSSLSPEELGARISKVLDGAGRKVRQELKEEYGG